MQHSWRYSLTHNWIEKFKSSKLNNNMSYIQWEGMENSWCASAHKAYSPRHMQNLEGESFVLPHLEHFGECHTFNSLLKTVCNACALTCARDTTFPGITGHTTLWVLLDQSSMLITRPSKMWKRLCGVILLKLRISVTPLFLPLPSWPEVTCLLLGFLFSVSRGNIIPSRRDNSNTITIFFFYLY